MTKCLQVFAANILGGENQGRSSAIVGAADLLNSSVKEDSVEAIYEEMCGSIDSHVYDWNSLTDEQRKKAVEKAILAYDKF